MGMKNWHAKMSKRNILMILLRQKILIFLFRKKIPRHAKNYKNPFSIIGTFHPKTHHHDGLFKFWQQPVAEFDLDKY